MSNIQVFSSSRYQINRPRIRAVVEEILQKKQAPIGAGINCVFVGKIKMREIALKYKQENVALPVLSFSYKGEQTDDPNLLGEVFLCYPQIVLLAAERNKKVEEMIDAMVKHGVENLFL